MKFVVDDKFKNEWYDSKSIKMELSLTRSESHE
jgi:hypothetical protein